MSRPLALPLHCKECHRRPPLRLALPLVDAVAHLPPDTEVGTWVCRCGRVHPITARDVARAA